MLQSIRFGSPLVFCILASLTVLSSFAHAIDPVRPGDKIEVLYLGSWLPGEVLEYKKGQARVRYTFVTPTEGIFTLDKMRFPNDEGTWMVWRDSTGQFQVEARLIGRTQTHVKLRKEDGNTIEVPIAKLADSLRAKLEKVATREKELVDAALVRVGDEVEVISFSTWYPGTVKKISQTGAVVSYTDSFGKQEKEVEYAKMRYPNGEGPWADWIDSTGNHKIKARYITHDETHVELLAESGKRIRLARAKLAESIESQLALRPILTRRPDEVDFDMSKVDYANIPSWTDFGSKSPEVLSTSLSLETAAPEPTIHEMAMTNFPNNLGSIDMVVAAGGDEGWIALGTSPAKDGPKQPASLHWFSTKSRTLQPGPKFFEGEIILGYSPSQNRLLTAEGLDLSGSATRFCTYRLSPGDKTAKAEWKWSVPKLSFFSSKNDLTARFVGEDRVLLGYGATVTLFDMKKKEALYAVPSTNAEIDLSPDSRYFCTNQFSRMVVVDANTGQPVAKNDYYKSGHFSRDGRYLLSSSNFSGALFDIRNSSEVFPIEFQSNPGVPQTITGSPTALGNTWFCDGQRLWDLQRKLLIWTYDLQGLTRHTQTMVGDKLLTVATHYVHDRINDLCISVITIPHAASVGSIRDVSDDELYLLRSGVKVKIDPSITESKILNGIRRAMAAANWKEDPQSSILIKASAKNGPSVSQTYSSSRFSGAGQETVSVAPWIQSLTIEYQSQPVWGTSQGGVPSIMVVRGGNSIQKEAQKYADPSYTLFEELVLPVRVLAPKWKNGFGTTQITPSGLKDVPVAR